ncbi:uncharacterized protein LOC144097112 isoform X2 [Amblyomma americanum]
MQRLSEFSLLFLLSLGGLLSNGDGNLREETNSLMELDIRKAFDTSDLVWLYQQNYNNTYNDSGPQGIEYHTYTCLRNNRTSLTEKQYNFTQTVKIDNREEVYQYSGNFVFNATKAENPPDSLLIYEYPGMADSPACAICGCDETTAHIHWECPAYSAERQSIFRALEHLDLLPLTETKIPTGHWPRRSSAGGRLPRHCSAF